jgi:hypothetical protein
MYLSLNLSESLYLCLYLCLYVFVYLSVYLPTYISVYLPIYPLSISVYPLSISVYLYLSLSISNIIYHCQSISISITLYLPLSTSIYLYPRIYQSINLSMAQSINLPIYQSMILEHIRLCMHTPSIMVPNALSVSFFRRENNHTRRAEFLWLDPVPVSFLGGRGWFVAVHASSASV